ncbi:hypothetical protein OROGR_012021 [Orobanche gracilis]
MILCDKKGIRIHASVCQHFVNKFENVLKEDVLGILTNVGEERFIDSSSRLTKLNVIELENKGVKITCSLWGVFVDQLNTYIETSFAGTTVVALFSVKIKEFQGKITLQNTMHFTKMVFNPKFPEAIELRGRA